MRSSRCFIMLRTGGSAELPEDDEQDQRRPSPPQMISFDLGQDRVRRLLAVVDLLALLEDLEALRLSSAKSISSAGSAWAIAAGVDHAARGPRSADEQTSPKVAAASACAELLAAR